MCVVQGLGLDGLGFRVEGFVVRGSGLGARTPCDVDGVGSERAAGAIPVVERRDRDGEGAALVQRGEVLHKEETRSDNPNAEPRRMNTRERTLPGLIVR